MADEKVTRKVTEAAPIKFATVVEDAPRPKKPVLNEKTRAEQAAGRAVLSAYTPVPGAEGEE